MKLVTLLTLAVLTFTSAAPVKHDEQIARYVDDIFFRYDKNEDHSLDRQESRNFFIDANEVEHVDDGEYTEWFRLIDANKDSKLQWEEIYKLAEAAAE